jgi:putative copper resistance protein D
MSIMGDWLHLIAVVLWLGGLFFMLFVLLPVTADKNGLPSSQFIQAAMRFRPVTWLAMALLVATGMLRIAEMGGMRQAPPVIHVKLIPVVIMIVLGLINSLVLLPRLAHAFQTASEPSAEQPGLSKTLRLFVLLSSLTLVLGLSVLYLMASAGYL